MRDIHCGTPQPNNAEGHFLARINADRVEFWCPKCKAWHVVLVIDLVAQSMIELRNGNEPREDNNLLW